MLISDIALVQNHNIRLEGDQCPSPTYPLELRHVSFEYCATTAVQYTALTQDIPGPVFSPGSSAFISADRAARK